METRAENETTGDICMKELVMKGKGCLFSVLGVSAILAL